MGALLQIVDHSTGNSYLPTYDANGNVTALLNAASGAAAAIYEYSPFGEPLRAQVNDSTVADQPFRFSTKFTDVETGLVYYGHRYYEPRNGRFINRDPIEESGGLNLYGFCGNNGINRWDLLGLAVRLYNLEGEPMELIPDGEPIPAGRWATRTGGFDTRNGGWGLGAGTISPYTGKPLLLKIIAPFISDYGGSGDPVFVSEGIKYRLIGQTNGDDSELDYVDSFGNIVSLVNGNYTEPDDDGASGGDGPNIIGGYNVTLDGFSAGTLGATEVAELQIIGHHLGLTGKGPSSNTSAPNSGAFTSTLGPTPSVFLSPGVVTPAPIVNAAAGTAITLSGYGTLNVLSSGADGGRQVMTFTPTNGQSPTDFAFIQYVTNDPQNGQRSPYIGGGSVPFIDAAIGHDSYTNPTGYYQDNFRKMGTYNNGMPIYSNGSINFYDHPQTGGPPLSFVTFLIDKNTGTILQPIHWGINGGG